jgi:uncharacterized protein YgbK (DUF1537 family)
MKMLIVADDLSGAADCAAGCVQAGLRTVVQLDIEADTSGYDVVSLDADSRRLPGAEAAALHCELLRGVLKLKPALLYKKIDSTLRGSFVQELFAARELTGTPIVVPSFPAMGRALVDGVLLVKGVALGETEVWKNEKRSGPSTLPAMLEAGGFASRLIALATVRGPIAALRAALAQEIGAPLRAIVCDAESEDDLARIAQATVALPGRFLLVGSAGLMRALPAAHGFSGSGGARPPEQQHGPVLSIVGSIAGASRAQCLHLAQTAATEIITIAPQLLRDGPAHPLWAGHRQRIVDALASRADVIVTIGGESPDLREGPALAAALGQLVLPALDLASGLILTGGETARAVLCARGVHALELIGELEAGIPLSLAVGMRGVAVITKAGAFGGEDCLSRGLRLLKTGA